MQDYILKALKLIIKQYYEIERTHWEEGGAKDDDHIFHALNDIHNYLKNHDEIDQVNQRERIDSAMEAYNYAMNIITSETRDRINKRALKQEDLRIQHGAPEDDAPHTEEMED